MACTRLPWIFVACSGLIGFAALYCLGAPAAHAQAQPVVSDYPIPGMNCAYMRNNVSPENSYYACYGQGAALSAPLPNIWGSIVMAWPNMTGASYNMRSRAAAETAALQFCREHYHVPKCEVMVSFENLCAAVAISVPEHITKVSKPSSAINWAETRVMDACKAAGGKSCQIAAAKCADNQRHTVPLDTCYGPSGNPVACSSSPGRGR